MVPFSKWYIAKTIEDKRFIQCVVGSERYVQFNCFLDAFSILNYSSISFISLFNASK